MQRDKVLKSVPITRKYNRRVKDITCNVEVSSIDDLEGTNKETCVGVFDTGSHDCLISPVLAKKLKLTVVGHKTIGGVNIDNLADEHLINLTLPNGKLLKAISVLEGKNLFDGEFIIGMCIINKGDFVITNANGKTSWSFRTPSVRSYTFDKEYEEAEREEKDVQRRQNKATKGSQKGRKRRRRR